MWKPEGKAQPGRSGRRWEDNINMDLPEVGCGGHVLDYCCSGWGQVAGFCVCGDEISDSIKCGKFLD